MADDWTDIPDTAVQQGAKPTGQTWTAMRDNIRAGLLRSTGAPVSVNGGLHPVDMVTIGDGSDGLIYDHAVHGTVSSVETGLWGEGFQTVLRIDGLGASTVSGAQLVIEVYKEADAAWQTAYTSVAILPASDRVAYGLIEFRLPRLLSRVHRLDYCVAMDTTPEIGAVAIFDATVQALSKARISMAGANIDAGKIYAYREAVQV